MGRYSPIASRLILGAVLVALASPVEAAPRVLRAAVLELAGYPPISVAEASDVAGRTAWAFGALFGLPIKIDVDTHLGARDVFARYVPAKSRLDRSAPPTLAELEKMRTALAELLSRTPVVGLEAVVGPGSPTERAARIVAGYERKRASLLDSWHRSEVSTADRPLEFLGTWDKLMRSAAPWDVLITNCPILYSSQDGSALHALIRGGALGGVTIWSEGPHPFGGMALVTSYALDARQPVVEASRGGPPLGPGERVEALSYLLAHELGHLIFKLTDNYTHANCLMHPPLDLRYLEWGRAVDPPGCPICRQAGFAQLAQSDAELAASRGELGRALALWRGVVAGARDPGLYNNFAWFCAEHSTDLDEARQYAGLAVKAEPGNAAFLDTLAWVFYRRAELAPAVALMHQALAVSRRKEDRGVLLYHVARIELALDRRARVGERLKEALDSGLAGEDAAWTKQFLESAPHSPTTSNSSRTSSPR